MPAATMELQETSDAAVVVEALLCKKHELLEQRDAQVAELVGVRGEAVRLVEELRVAEAAHALLEAQARGYKEQALAHKAEADKEGRRRERLEREMGELRATLKLAQTDLDMKQHAMDQSNEQAQTLEQRVINYQAQPQIAPNSREAEGVMGEGNALAGQAAALHARLQEQVSANTRLLAQAAQHQLTLRRRDDDIHAMQEEALKAGKVREAAVQKLAAMQQQKADAERARDDMKAKVRTLERAMEGATRQQQQQEKRCEEAGRARDALHRRKVQAEGKAVQAGELIKFCEAQRRQLERQIQEHQTESQRQAKVILGLEAEREAHSAQAQAAAVRHAESAATLALRDRQIAGLGRQLDAAQLKLKEQQSLYDAACAERNLVSKKLIGVQQEMLDTHAAMKALDQQMQQMKEEIRGKEASTAEQTAEHARAARQCEQLTVQVEAAQQGIARAEADMAAQRGDLARLDQLLKAADQERDSQKRECAAVGRERDLLAKQLVRCNGEVAQLYARIKLQAGSLSQGRGQYLRRAAQLKALQGQLAGLRREQHLLKDSAAHVDGLKREVTHLQQALLQEQQKVRALGEELGHPLNVHRWRRLEGADPERYEMVMRVQALQKQLMRRSAEVAEKDAVIQEKEGTQAKLQTQIARYPGPEAAEKLIRYQAALADNMKQMKIQQAELTMFQVEVYEYKAEIEQLKSDLKKIKQQQG